jgi:photosystem II stability/assembly factor-like uncharacterized protein
MAKWESIKPLSANHPYANLGFSSSTGEHLIVYEQSGSIGAGKLHVSHDYGSTWTTVIDGTIPYIGPLEWLAASDDAQKIYLTDWSVHQSYILRSIDGGANWGTCPMPYRAYSSVTCSSDGSIVYSVSIHLRGTQPEVIYKSIDYGDNWSTQNFLSANQVKCSADGSVVLLLTIPDEFGNIEVHVSDDGAATWAHVHDVTDGGNTFWKATDITADGTGMIIHSSDGKAWLSTDTGQTWTMVVDTNPHLFVFGAHISNDAAKIYLGTPADGYATFSYDGGATWDTDSICPNRPEVLDINGAGDVLLGGVDGSGFFRFTDTLPSSCMRLLSITPESGTVDGGTPVTVSGEEFTESTVIYLDGAALNDQSFVDSQTITGTTPAHYAGAVDVVAENP